MTTELNNFNRTLTRVDFSNILTVSHRGKSLLMLKKQQNCREEYGVPVLSIKWWMDWQN